MTAEAIARVARAIARQKAAEGRYYACPSSPVREQILGRDLDRARAEVEAASIGIPDRLLADLIRYVEAG